MERVRLEPEESIGPGKIIPKTQIRQEDCCPASVFSILSTLGVETSYDELYLQLGTNKQGTADTSKISEVFNKHNIKIKEYEQANMKDMENALSEGNFCLVEYQAPNYDYGHDFLWLIKNPTPGNSKKHGHYSVIYKIDKVADGKKFMWLMDPLIIGENETPYGVGVRVMTWDHLQKRWEIQGEEPGWMLTISSRMSFVN